MSESTQQFEEEVMTAILGSTLEATEEGDLTVDVDIEFDTNSTPQEEQN
jgi:hypothetical protein